MKSPDVYSMMLCVMFKRGMVSTFGGRDDYALVVDGACGMRDLLEPKYGMYGVGIGDYVYTVRLMMRVMASAESIVGVIMRSIRPVCEEFNLFMRASNHGEVSFSFMMYHAMDRTPVSVMKDGRVAIFHVVVQYVQSDRGEFVIPQIEKSVTVDNIIPVYTLHYSLFLILSTLVNKNPCTSDELWPNFLIDGIAVFQILIDDDSSQGQCDDLVFDIQKCLRVLLVKEGHSSMPFKIRRRIMPLYTDIAARVSV